MSRLLQFIPPRLEVEEQEWQRDGVGKVHFRPLLWTVEPPAKPGYYWCRFPGMAEREVVRVEAGFDYVAGDIEWSTAPIPEPWG